MSWRYGTVRSTVAVVVALLVGVVGSSGHTCPHHVSPSSQAPDDRSAAPFPREHGSPSDHSDPSALDASSDEPSHGDHAPSCTCVGFCQTAPMHAALADGSARVASSGFDIAVATAEPSTAIQPARTRWTLPPANAPPPSSPARSV